MCLHCTGPLKTLWEKEKLLIMSNFSSSHSVFYLFGELYTISNSFEIVVCKLFLFGRVKNSSFGKGLVTLFCFSAKPHSSFSAVADLRTGGLLRFDLRLGQYFTGGLMIVIVTGFIPLSPLSIVLLFQ